MTIYRSIQFVCTGERGGGGECDWCQGCSEGPGQTPPGLESYFHMIKPISGCRDQFFDLQAFPTLSLDTIIGYYPWILSPDTIPRYYPWILCIDINSLHSENYYRKHYKYTFHSLHDTVYYLVTVREAPCCHQY